MALTFARDALASDGAHEHALFRGLTEASVELMVGQGPPYGIRLTVNQGSSYARLSAAASRASASIRA